MNLHTGVVWVDSLLELSENINEVPTKYPTLPISYVDKDYLIITAQGFELCLNIDKFGGITGFLNGTDGG